MNYQLTHVLHKKFHGREWTLQGEDFDTIVFIDGKPPISKEELIAADKQLYTEESAVKYKKDRLDNYPDLKLLIQMLADDIESGKDLKLGTFYAAVKDVHDKYPKPAKF